MKRLTGVAIAALAISIGSILVQRPMDGANAADPPPLNGRIAFERSDTTLGDQVIYTVNPDGTHEQLVQPDPAEGPHWSPDGEELAMVCCRASSRIVTIDTGAVRTLPWPDGLFLGCLVWSADGSRQVCEGFGLTDPERNGIYSIRASDGGGLIRLTTNPDGDDIPYAVSPDGSRMAFGRDGAAEGIYVANADGSNPVRLDTGALLDVPGVAWSPDGAWFVFSARKAAGERRSLFVIRPDGTGLREIAITPACGGQRADQNSRGCLDPTWSPDGKTILFDILLASNGQKQLYTVDLDGKHLAKVTRHGFVFGGEGEQAPDWGIHPLQ